MRVLPLELELHQLDLRLTGETRMPIEPLDSKLLGSCTSCIIFHANIPPLCELKSLW